MVQQPSTDRLIKLTNRRMALLCELVGKQEAMREADRAERQQEKDTDRQLALLRELTEKPEVQALRCEALSPKELAYAMAVTLKAVVEWVDRFTLDMPEMVRQWRSNGEWNRSILPLPRPLRTPLRSPGTPQPDGPVCHDRAIRGSAK